MTGSLVRFVVVCASALALAGCLSVNVDKTETNSAKAIAPTGLETQASIAESAD